MNKSFLKFLTDFGPTGQTRMRGMRTLLMELFLANSGAGAAISRPTVDAAPGFLNRPPPAAVGGARRTIWPPWNGSLPLGGATTDMLESSMSKTVFAR